MYVFIILYLVVSICPHLFIIHFFNYYLINNV